MTWRTRGDRPRWQPQPPTAEDVGIFCMMLVILAAFWALWMRAERAYAAEAASPVRVVEQEGPRSACSYGGDEVRWHVAVDPNTGLPRVADDGNGCLLLLAADGRVSEVHCDGP